MSRRKSRLRRIVWTLVGLTVALTSAYAYLTNPARLRSQALAALRSLPVQGIDVADVSYTPWGGLEITDLTIPAPGSGVGPQTGTRPVPPPLLQIAHARITCRLLGLLCGRVEPAAIDVEQMRVTVVCGTPGERSRALSASYDDEARRLWELLANTADELPRVTLRRTDLQLMTPERGRLRLLERWQLHAAGAPADGGYTLRVEPLPARDRALVELRWEAPRGELEVRLDWADLDTLDRVLPARLTEALEPLRLAGRARVDRLVLRTRAAVPAAQLAALEVQLADVRGVVPLEDQDRAGVDAEPAAHLAEPFLRMTDMSARLSFRGDDPAAPGRIELSAEGRLNGAPASLALTADGGLLPGLSGWPGSRAAATPPDKPFDLDDLRAAELRVDAFELPTAERNPGFIGSRRLPHPIVAALADYRPRGKVNLRLRVLPRATRGGGEVAPGGAARFEGEIEALGATCRYRHFPYDFQDVHGRVRFAGGPILLDGLSARHGAGRIWMDGAVHDSKSWTGFELRCRGEGVALDGDLFAALPDQYRRLWQAAAPLGLCDVATTLRRDDGTPARGALPADVHVDANLLNGSLGLGDDRRLDHADGQLSVQGGVVTVQDLHGYEGGTAVRLSGRVWLADGAAQHDLHVEVTDLPLDEQAALGSASADERSAPGGRRDADAVSAGDPTTSQRIRLVGRGDAWGRMFGNGGPAGRQQDFAVQIKDGQLYAFDPTRAWTDTRGWVTVHGERRQLVSFTCRQGQAWLDASGTLPGAGQSGAPLALDLRAGTPALEELLPQFVPAAWSDFAAALGLSGSGEVTVRLRPGEGEQVGGQAADIELHAAQTRARPLPLPLRDVSAHLTVVPGHFELRRAAAQCQQAGRIQAHGQGTWQSGETSADFDMEAHELEFSPELLAALPDGVRSWLTKLAPRGRFDVLLPRVQVSGGSAQAWRLEGRLPLREAAFHFGLDVSGLDGELSGVCSLDPAGEFELAAQLAVQRAQLAGRPVEQWTGQLVHQRGQDRLRLDNLHGRLCGGEALGSLSVDPNTAEYELSVTLRDIQVSELLPPPKSPAGGAAPAPTVRMESPGAGNPRRGRMDGQIALRGRGDEVARRRGGGDVRIRGSSFLQLPVLASIFDVGRPGQPALSENVDQVDIRFLWEGAQVRLLRAEIQSRDLRLVGEGTWNLRDDALDLTLYGASPKDWPRLAMLSDVLELAGQELIQYRVEGTLASPAVTVEPLHKLNAALRALLKSGK